MRNAAVLVVGGATVWAVALLVGPLLRGDLDPVAAHPEAYATGPWAPLMRAGYVGVALASAASAVLARRHPIAAALLAACAAGALVIGIVPPRGSDTLGDILFPAAQLAPLAFLPAIAWISWREQRRGLIALAVLVWLLFAPLLVGEPPAGGIINRAADLAMAAWLVTFALPSLTRPVRTRRATSPDPTSA